MKMNRSNKIKILFSARKTQPPFRNAHNELPKLKLLNNVECHVINLELETYTIQLFS